MNKYMVKLLMALSHAVPRIGYPVLSGPLKGVRFIWGSHAGECGGVSVYVNRTEPEQLQAFTSALSQGQTFLDIGANVGLYTMLASRLVGQTGKVIAVEPDVRNLCYLYQHVCLNKSDNTTILPGACYDQCSLQTFYSGSNNATGHLSSDGESDNTTSMLTPVLSVSIDEIVATLHVTPNVIKIDVEGAEMEVLQGGRKILDQAHPIIFLSTHSVELRKNCLEYLRGIGYTVIPLASNDCDHASEFIAKPASSES
jgi:FkbM family methyltransferase